VILKILSFGFLLLRACEHVGADQTTGGSKVIHGLNVFSLPFCLWERIESKNSRQNQAGGN